MLFMWTAELVRIARAKKRSSTAAPKRHRLRPISVLLSLALLLFYRYRLAWQRTKKGSCNSPRPVGDFIFINLQFGSTPLKFSLGNQVFQIVLIDWCFQGDGSSNPGFQRRRFETIRSQQDDSGQSQCLYDGNGSVIPSQVPGKSEPFVGLIGVNVFRLLQMVGANLVHQPNTPSFVIQMINHKTISVIHYFLQGHKELITAVAML
jgi:hypothetical protein